MLYRSFIALELADTGRQRLAELADYYQAHDKHHEIRWTDVDNYHLTLAFLGDQAAEHLQLLAEHLVFGVELQDDFIITINELSYFPYHSRPNVVAAMVTVDENLLRVKNQVDNVLRSVGTRYDKRKFIPHITLGRVRARKTPRLAVPPTCLSLHIECPRLILFRSELRPSGPVYTPICEVGIRQG